MCNVSLLIEQQFVPDKSLQMKNVKLNGLNTSCIHHSYTRMLYEQLRYHQYSSLMVSLWLHKKKTIPSHYTHSRICSIELCTKRGCEETRKKIRISLFLSICEMQQHFLSLLFPPFLLILALFMAVAWKCLHENRKNNQRNLCDVIFVCAQLNADLLTVSVMPLFYLDRPLPCLAEIFCYCNCGRKQTQ